MLESVTQDMFKEKLNSTFNLKLNEEQSLTLELTECNDVGSSETQEQFSLIFRGPVDCYLQQMIYPLVQEGFAELSLFLVPIRKDTNGYYYEAIVNRFRR